MEYLPFPARLCAGNICEVGLGQVAEADNAVDFTGDFIPLLPLGQAAAVEWILGDGVVRAYQGEVYLSSPALLRLVRVDAGLVAEARRLFATNLRLRASFASPDKTSPRVPAQVLYLTTCAATLAAPMPLEPGTRLWLDCEADFLTLRAVPLQVKSAIPLRKSQALLHCTLAAGSEENLVALSAYTARLEKLEDV